jgi:hypothetical protein
MMIGTGSYLSASTRAEVNILEATEHIRYLSQDITKNYLYYYANPKKEFIRKRVLSDLEKLVSDIRTIAITTNKQDTKDILEFLTYSKNQIEEILKSKPNKEKAALMLDYSETLLEGANSIAKQHSYIYTDSEKMLLTGKNIGFFMERIEKYYLAVGIGLSSSINIRLMKDAIRSFDKNIEGIMKYDSYPKSLNKKRELLYKYWLTNRSLIEKYKEFFVSNIVELTTDKLEKIAENFIVYHSKNQ